jgi:translation initiation factor RLI1
MRFRDEELTFKVSENENDQMMAKLEAAEGNDKLKAALKRQHYSYPNMTKTLGPFKLTV